MGKNNHQKVTSEWIPVRGCRFQSHLLPTQMSVTKKEQDDDI